jgi:transposase-like protein
MEKLRYVHSIRPKSCKYCGSTEIIKGSAGIGKNGIRKQTFRCKNCGRMFYGLNPKK